MTVISPMRHYGGFVAAGSLAALTDWGVMQSLSGLAGLDVLIARFVSIWVAMAVSFLVNRTVTFAVPGPPRFAEFLHFAAVAWIASGINYAVFAAVLITRPVTSPTIAFVLATAIAMVASYLGMRLGVFRRRS